MVVLLAKLKAKKDSADEVAGHLREMVEWVVANEPGTVTYACNRSQADPAEFLFFERYVDAAAQVAHSQSARFGELVARLQGKLAAAPELVMLDEVAAKI